MLKKICFVILSRANYSSIKSVIFEFKKDRSLKSFIITGASANEDKFGNVSELIEKDFKIDYKINMPSRPESLIGMPQTVGGGLIELPLVLDKIKPDLVLITGDRAEMFIAALTAAYMKIAVAHIQSGDLSGHIDGSVRHAITKISHLHFASCEDSKKRVLKLGEESWRVYNTGAPQLDDFNKPIKINFKDFNKKYKIKLEKKFVIIMQHPVLYDNVNSGHQIEQTLKAVEKFSFQKIIIYPNIDTGNNKIIKIIDKYKNQNNFIIFKNLKRDHFIFLLKNAEILIGNSSCGILEAASFKLPVINIGNRQKGRLQSKNILNAGYSSKEIMKAIKIIYKSKKYKKDLRKCKNLYGDGKSSERIVRILKKIRFNKSLLDKTNSY